jgi:hypothetical protein
MDCLTCTHLLQAFESKLSKYIEARSAAYYRVSTELAAHKNVDMERARNDLEQHQFVCLSAARVRRVNPQDADVCAIFRGTAAQSRVAKGAPLVIQIDL